MSLNALQIDLVKGMMDCLYAECTPCITDCVMAELEKLGQKYRVALKVAKASMRVPQHQHLTSAMLLPM
jgi:rRNA-processing protein FCF1